MYIFKDNDNVYDWISCIHPKLYFGPYPNQIMINQLLKESFNMIINLTHENEQEQYECPNEIEYHNFKIKDNDTPISIYSYCKFIYDIKKYFTEGKKIYIHCRGGHGRSSMVSVSVYNVIFNTELKKSIEIVSKAHNDRVVLREKWKKYKNPFNFKQFSFLSKVHKNIYISMKYHNKYYHWLYFEQFIDYYKSIFENVEDKEEDKEEEDKEQDLSSFFIQNIKNDKDIEYNMFFTYLKNIVVTDCDDKKFIKIYENGIKKYREILFYQDIKDIKDNLEYVYA